MLTVDLPIRTPTLASNDDYLLHGLLDAVPSIAGGECYSVINEVFNHYATQARNPDCEAMLQSCLNVEDPQVLHDLSVGHASRTLGRALAPQGSTEWESARGMLAQLSLLRPQGSELFRGAAVFPLRDNDGHVVEAYGLRTAERVRNGAARELSWSVGSGHLFNHDALWPGADVVLCETPFHALGASLHGGHVAVAPRGFNGLNEVQLDDLRCMEPNRVIIAFGPDPHLQRSAALIAQCLDAYDIDVWGIEAPKTHRSEYRPVPFKREWVESITTSAKPFDYRKASRTAYGWPK